MTSPHFSSDKLYVVCALATDGHVDPMFAVAKELSSRGARVLTLTHKAHCKRFSCLGLKLVPIDDDSHFQLFDARIELLNRPGTVAQFFAEVLLPLAEKETSCILDLLNGSPGVIITADAPGIGARLATEVTNSTLVSLFTAPGFLYTRPLYSELLRTQLAEPLYRLRKRFCHLPLLPHSRWMDLARLNFALWPEWFGDRHRSNVISNIRFAGFTWFEQESDHPAPDYKETREEVIVTGGSAHCASQEFFRAAIEGCHMAGKTARVLTRHSDLLPPKLPSTVTVSSWVPSLRLCIRPASLVIHHGGMGTIVRCLKERKPQLVMAAGGDRPESGRIIHRLNLGRFLAKPKWTAENVAANLAQLSDPLSWGPIMRALSNDDADNGAAVIVNSVLNTV